MELQIFTPGETRAFGERICNLLGLAPAGLEERRFADGEHKLRPLESVRGRDVFVVQSLYGDGQHSVNDKLCRLLFLLSTVRDAGAARVTAVLPYLCYTRKDRRTKWRDPLTSRYLAQQMEATGLDAVITLDAHNLAAYQNAYRCRAEHLDAVPLFLDHFAPRLADDSIVVVSPDPGGMKRAERFRQALERRLGTEIGGAFVEKFRSSEVVTGDRVGGDVRDRIAVIIDDMVTTGGTLARAARACRKEGAREVLAAASHAVFTDETGATLADAPVDHLAVTNSIAPERTHTGLGEDRLTVLDACPLFAEAIRRIHTNGSLVELLDV